MVDVPITINAKWLMENLEKPNLKVVDASSHLPTTKRNAKAEFLACRIKNAVFFDINAIADTKSPLPHTLPSPEVFAEEMSLLGLSDNDHVIAYCNSDLFSAARAWWMLRFFGHPKVSVLNGGLQSWLKIDGKLDKGPLTEPKRGYFSIRQAIGSDTISFKNLRSLVENGTDYQIADARSSGRFGGTEPEPRKGVRSGRIPGSCNVPISSLLSNGRLKDVDALAKAFAAGGVNIKNPVITTCGSGVTACGLALALALLGNEKTLVYDGSWSEWGSSDAPIL